jgi:hypothetical protein
MFDRMPEEDSDGGEDTSDHHWNVCGAWAVRSTDGSGNSYWVLENKALPPYDPFGMVLGAGGLL